jgi:hypothetical protein
MRIGASSRPGAGQMRFDIYGRYEIEILREGDSWVAYRVGIGIRSVMNDLVIPRTVAPDELEVYLDDMLHELAEPGRAIRRVG